jgi:LuxR family transcriptional regulator of csgAB operon
MTARDSSRPERQIIILGPRNLQNELLAYVLEKETSVPSCVKDPEEPNAEQPGNQALAQLLFVDCAGRIVKRTLEELHSNKALVGPDSIIALFSLHHGRGIEQEALQRGVKGFFYQNESLQLILRGVKALFRGEIWLSREVLAECVANNARRRLPTIENEAGLSSREMEILALISIGASNEEISEKLYISPHTVKTHLYHIFKKIKVPSRLQAALWAAKNI